MLIHLGLHTFMHSNCHVYAEDYPLFYESIIDKLNCIISIKMLLKLSEMKGIGINVLLK